MVAVYFFAYEGIHSIKKVIGLVAASTFAYYFSILGGILLGIVVDGAANIALGVNLDYSSGSSGELGAGMLAPLFIAGVIGAFVLLLAVLRLYSAETSWRRISGRALPWSLVGGFLAILGWGTGPSLGMAVWSALKSHQLVMPNADAQYATLSQTSNHYAADIVWQIGMSIVLGIVISESRTVATAHIPSIPRRGLRPSNGFLLAVISLSLGYFVLASLPDDYQQMLWRRAHRQELAAEPKSNIPKMNTTPAETMLIVAKIDGYLPEPTRAEHSTTDQVYTVRYSVSGNPDVCPSCVGPHVDAIVHDWPSGWARSELGLEERRTPKVPDEESNWAEERTEFGNRVLFRRNPDPQYVWISNNVVVTLTFYSVAPEGFLRKYLERYPSTL